MMMRIVSANYRDRKSPDKWLIREESQDPDAAVPCKTVRATGVVFCPSTAYEYGFGCSTVAFCETAVGGDETLVPTEADTVRLHFNGAYFVTDDHDRVRACTTLFLGADGAMYASLPKSEEASAAGTARGGKKRRKAA